MKSDADADEEHGDERVLVLPVNQNVLIQRAG